MIEMYNIDYSMKEYQLVSKFGFGNLCDHLCNPIGLYRICMEEAFIKNEHGSHVDALRNAMKVFYECKIYRLTEEFETLITFEKV